MKFKIIFFLLAVLAAGILYLSLFTVKEHESVVVTQFGKLVRIEKKPGLHWKLPWIFNTVNRIDIRTRIIDTGDIQILLSDKNPLVINCYVAWKVNDPLVYLQAVGNDINAENKLRDMAGSAVGIIMGGYRKDDIIQTDKKDAYLKISGIETEILQPIKEKSESRYGITPVKAGIQRMSYPAAVSESVYERMKSERNKEAARIRAEGRIASNRITAEADKEAEEIMAEAEKKALIIRGEADRKAMEILSESYSRAPEFYRFTNSLETYEKIFDKDTTLFLSTNSPILKYLDMGAEK
ncbi:MAG: protease modulator HflC [bacterium]